MDGSAVEIQVNGESRQIAAATTISGLLETLQIRTTAVAVELNRAIVPRARHGATVLEEGDEVEIVTAVGGG